jgi:hypothetical protein
MKRLFRTFMVLSAATLFFATSCKKDDTEDTTTSNELKVTMEVRVNGALLSNNGYAFPDDSLSVKVKVTGTDKNNVKRIKISANNTTFTGVDTPKTGTTAEENVAFWAVQGTAPVTFTAVATGADGKTVTSTFVLNISDVNVANPTLGNQASSNPKFWSMSNDSVYTLFDVKMRPTLASALDVAYVSRTNGGNKIISPASTDAFDIYATQWSASDEKITNWTKRNNTKFKIVSITQSQFQAAGNSKSQINALINTAIAAGEPTDDAVSVISTHVLLLKTEDGRYGLMNVVQANGSVTGGTADPGDVQIVVYYKK